MNGNLEEKFNKALFLYKLEKFIEADDLFEQIAEEIPDSDDILVRIFKVYYKANDFGKAVKYIKRAIDVNKNPDYYRTLGNIYYDKQDYMQAKECFLPVLKAYPDNEDCFFKIGVSCSFNLQFDEAVEYFNKAIALNPADAVNYYNLAIAYRSLYELDKAVESLVRAIELNPKYPEAVTLLGKIFLQTGNFAEGWKLYEGRFFKQEGVSRIKSIKPEWEGSSLNGKTIYIQREQGLGDCIMFARYIHILNSMGATVLFKPHSELKQLFKDSNLPAEIIDESVAVESLEFDTHLSIMSLARVLNASENNIPYTDKYLKANPEKVKKYKEEYFNNDKFKIGIVWQCRDITPLEKHRSIPDISYLYPITEIPEVKFYSLQKGKAEKQLDNLPDDANITILGKTFNDFSDTAAAVENLDLVVSVDTSVAHLSGALGKDTLVLLDYMPDWKWLLNRDDCIWYDKIKLIRHNKSQSWNNMVDGVIKHIKNVIT